MSENTNEIVDVQEKVTLGLDDIARMYQVLLAVSQRGAIRAEEMTTVGQLHDRIFLFLKQEGVINNNPPEEN